MWVHTYAKILARFLSLFFTTQHRLLDGAGNIQNWRHDHLSLPTVGHHLKGRPLLDNIAARLREAIRFCVVVSYGFFVATYLRVHILVMFSLMPNYEPQLWPTIEMQFIIAMPEA